MEEPEYSDIAGKYTLNLSLRLDDYDYIYSDFDSGNYLKRRVSADFINELRTSLKNKTENRRPGISASQREKAAGYFTVISINNFHQFFYFLNACFIVKFY